MRKSLTRSKSTVHLSIDPDILDAIRGENINMSQEVENYFRALMGKKENEPINIAKETVEKLERDLARARVEQAKFDAIQKQKQKEDMKITFKKDVEFMKKQFRASEANKESWEAAHFKPNLKKFKEKYGLGHKTAMDYATGIKDVE